MPEASRTLADLAAAVGGSVEGDAAIAVSGVAPLEEAGPADLSFLANPRYRQKAMESRAGAILAAPGVDLPGRTVIRVADPYLAMARILALFHPPAARPAGVDARAIAGGGCRIDPAASILAGAILGDRVTVGPRSIVHPGACVGDDVAIGADCVIHSNATLYPRTVLRDRVIVHASCVIGSDGFGYAHDGRAPVKIPQVGNVVIEEDVEIGAGTTIDRATFGSTRIGRGCKIDNLVQIGHNVTIGEGSILVAQSGISGSTQLGKGVIVAGQSGAVGHITIGDGSKIGAKSAVTHDLPAGSFVIGHPAVEAGVWKRAAAAFVRLPEILRRLRALERGGSGETDD